MSSPFVVTLAATAKPAAYAALIASTIVNRDEPESPIDLKLVDDKLVDSKDAQSDVTFATESATISGNAQVLKTLGDKFPNVLYPKSGKDEAEKWAKFAFDELTSPNFKAITPALEKLEAHLNFRSYLVGYSASIADIAVWGVLRANNVVGGAIKSGTFINLARWYNLFQHCKYFGGAVDKTISDLNALRKSGKVGQKKESKASYDIDLVDAKDGEVVTRFPPEPSGYLHIGHAKAAVLNQYFARAYHGKLIVRFDDTNPSKEKVEFEESIVEDLELLGIKPDRVTHSSDYFQEMHDYAVQMIKEDKAYADDTPQEIMRDQRMNGTASARRNRPVEESLQIFEQEMAKGTEIGQTYCIRAKISVDDNNKTLRDPVIYRVNVANPHHRTGTKWKAYPTYDFCVPIVDALEGVTHALRTTEYRDRNAQYAWMLKAMNLRTVHVWDFSRVNFIRTVLSKRKLQWFVDTKRVAGWDDPRFPTVRGVRRRGMTVEGLQTFIIAQGPSKNILNLEWSSIWAANKKVIDPISPRFVCVTKNNAVKVNVLDGPAEPKAERRPKHKKNPDVGDKDIIYYKSILIDQDDAELLKDNEELTLMDWGNAIVQKITKTGDGVVESVDVKLHLEGDFKKTEKKITWVADTADTVPVELVDFDHLISKDRIEEDEKFEDFLTEQTEFRTLAIADLNIKDLKQGDIIQFERKGYFRLDEPATGSSPAVFFTIPDGKTVSKYGAKK